MRYECVGSVRGKCGHKHRTIKGAVKCLLRDKKICIEQRGYSDRNIYRENNVSLDEREYREYMYLLERHINASR